jgi:predicted secreted protein
MYVVIWWITLFAVLPWGNRAGESPEPGHDLGAPARPRIGLKALINSVVAAVVWLAIWAAIETGIIPIHG